MAWALTNAQGTPGHLLQITLVILTHNQVSTWINLSRRVYDAEVRPDSTSRCLSSAGYPVLEVYRVILVQGTDETTTAVKAENMSFRTADLAKVAFIVSGG